MQPTFLHDLVDQQLSSAPARVAIADERAQLSFADTASASRRLAAWMQDAGVSRGDRVCILLPNGIPVALALLAASRVGALFFVLNPQTKPYQLRHILADSEPRLIITTAGRPDLDELRARGRVLLMEDGWEAALVTDRPFQPPAMISSDPVCLVYTSGSTGYPKAVISSHRNVLFAVQAIQERLQIRPEDSIGDFLPLSFDYGLYQIYLSLNAGARIFIGAQEHVDAGILSRLVAAQITVLPLVPGIASMVTRLARRNRGAMPAVRIVTNTGAHLSEPMIKDLKALFPEARIFPMFGLTECKRISILLPEEYERKPRSVGRPLADTECFIVDGQGNPLPPGTVGELVVRGPHVMSGYWRAPEITAKRFRPWGPGLERALFTGDQCSLDEDGFLYFHGRADDIFKSQGYRVSGPEIETAACDVPGVHEAALILADGGATPVLFALADLTSDVLLDHLRRRLEEYKLPRRVVVLEVFPRNTSGKVDRALLKETFAASSGVTS